MSENRDNYGWNIFSFLTKHINYASVEDRAEVVDKKCDTKVTHMSEFDLINKAAIKSVKSLSSSDKLLLLVHIKRKYYTQKSMLNINKEVLCVFHIIKEVFGDSFQKGSESEDIYSSTSSLYILQTIQHFVNNKFDIETFKPAYQAIILDGIKNKTKILDTHNSKTIKSHLSVFNSFPTSKVALSDREIKLFSKSVDDLSSASTKPSEKESSKFISSLLDLNGTVDDVSINEQQIERTGYFNALTSGSLLSTIQGTINSVYKTEENNNKPTMKITTKESLDIKEPFIITQVVDSVDSYIKLLVDHQYKELLTSLHVKNAYKPLSKRDLFSEDSFINKKSLKIDFDNCVFLPSSNINEYFYKRGILSKIGLGIRDHYKLDTGDLHLYLSNSYAQDFNNKAQKTIDTKTNVIICFQVCDLRYNADTNASDHLMSSKILADIADENLRNILKAPNCVNKKVTIDVPAIGTDFSNIDLVIERVQDVFLRLDTEMNIFSGEMDNLLFLTSGESFNLLILCLPYLKDYIQMKHHDSKSIRHFNYGKYPIKKSLKSIRSDEARATFHKVGVLGLDVNPSYSSLYLPMGDLMLCKDSMLYESFNWALYNNITISLVADLYDCHQHPLQDKLLTNMLHPHLIRGLNVQINQIEDDSSLIYTEDYQNIKNAKIPVNRRYEVVLAEYLLTFLNLGYNINDTVPLLNMISKIYESRAFNNLTRTPQLRRKLDKLKKEFVDKIERLHIDWQSVDPETILKSLDESGIDSDVEKLHYMYYVMIKNQLENSTTSKVGDILPSVKSSSIWSNNEVYKFFISNTLFTAFNYPQQNISIYNIAKMEETEISRGKGQFLLIWKLRDFATNFVKMDNLPFYLNDIQNRLEKETINSHYSSDDFEYANGRADSIQCMKYLYKCYLNYAPPANNKNLNEFKKEVLDMTWDAYESSDDFIEDLVN